MSAEVRRLSAGRPRFVAGAPVVTMGHVTVSDGGYATGIGDSLLSQVFNQTSDVLTWVDSSTGFIIHRAAREMALQDDGRTDPFTHIDDHIIPPDTQIEGELTPATTSSA
jgi:hypothetical protein